MKQETLALETSAIIRAIKMKWLTMTAGRFVLVKAHSFELFVERPVAQDRHIYNPSDWFGLKKNVV